MATIGNVSNIRKMGEALANEASATNKLSKQFLEIADASDTMSSSDADKQTAVSELDVNTVQTLRATTVGIFTNTDPEPEE